MNPMRYPLLIFMFSLSLSPLASAESRGLDVGIAIGQHKIDWDYSGNLRETRLSQLDVAWQERLAPAIRGGIELGYLELTQYSNPIPVGQTGSGGYLGLNLSFLIISTADFELYTRLGYRYSEVSKSATDQSVDWDWHQGQIGLYSKFRLTESFRLLLGASALAIDGRERAEGTVTSAQPFKAAEPLSGHIGLQLGLDHTGTIGIKIDSGSLRGGRITFQRIF